MLKFIIILCVFITAVAGAASARDVEWRLGGMVQAGAAFHNANFKELPGVPLPSSAQLFSGATGFSYGVGGIVEWQSYSWLAVGMQTDIQGTSVVLTAAEGPLPYLAQDGQAGDVLLQHTIRHSLLTLGVQPVVVLSPWQPMFVRVGWRLGFPILSSFEQTEELVDASPGLEYLIGSGKRVRASGASLPGASAVENAMEFGIGYEIPFNSSFVLRPFLSYRASLTDRVAGISWKTGSLQVSASLFRQFLQDKDVQVDTVYRRDTTVQLVAGIVDEEVNLVGQSVQTDVTESESVILQTVVVSEQYSRVVPQAAPLLAAELGVRFVLKDGKETEGVRVSVETVLEKNVVPMLPYIFFEPMSALVPARYALLSPSAAGSFAPDQLDRKDVLDIYRNLLNIIGQRLQRKPDAMLVLVGTNSGDGDERKNTGLSQQRAEAVRQYLVDSWGIAAERLIVRAANLPSHPSNSSLPGGSAENRRVELSSDDPSILAPVFLQDTVRAANPPIIRFYPDVLSEAGVADWQITISQGERFSKIFADSSEPPKYIDWNIDQDKAALISADAPMQYSLRVRDLAEGSTETGQGSIVFQVQQQGGESTEGRGEVTRYSLIVFDYDGADLTKLHRTALAAIREAFPANASITVIGMTDELGDAEYNRQLSERRAKAIASALELPASVAIGIGEQSEISSETPEGRFYSRRVDILIRRSNSP